MSAIREWLDRLLGTLRLRRGDADLEAELRSHAEQAGDGYASRVGLTQTMDAMRDRRGLPWLHALSSDVVFAWRQLVAHRVVSVAAILSLGLAIGATSAVFRLVDAVLLRPLPIAAPERLAFAVTWFVDAQQRFDYYDSWDYPTYTRYVAMVGDRADLLLVGSSSPTEAMPRGASQPERVNRQYYSGNVFGVFGLQPALGRLFGPADDRTPGGHPIVVLSFDYWQRRFGGDPQVIGSPLRFGGQILEVIGVAPEGFTGTEPGRAADAFVPALMNVEPLDKPGWGWFRLWVRPRDGVTLASVEQLLQADQLREQREALALLPPDAPAQRIAAIKSRRVELQPAASGASAPKKDFRRPLVVLASLVGVMLLIACVNVANLQNAQALARRREMALRVSIGAGRWRLVRLMLVESTLLAVCAWAVGTAFAWWAAPFVVSQLSTADDPIRLALGLDWRSLAFGLGLIACVTALFGTLPALRASAVTPIDALKSGGRVTGHRRLTHSLIGAQTAFCVFVVFVAVLLVSTFARLATYPLGFRPDHLLVAEVDVPPSPLGHTRWLSVVDQVRATPGVESATLAGWPLLRGNRWRADVRAEGKPPQPDPAYFLAVSSGFFATMQMPLLDGRELRTGDARPDIDESRRPLDGVALVNQSFARAYFAGRSPVGERVSMEIRPRIRASIEIVGLVGDAVYASLRDPIRPTLYVPARQNGTATLILRTVGEPEALAPILRRVIEQARPDAHIRLIATQMEFVQRQLLRERLLAKLSGFVAVVALLLSAIGLYGVLHHAVILQQRPIGIRLALGAGAAHVVRQVTGSLLAAVAVGAGIGLGGGLFFGRVLEGLLFRVSTTDATSLGAPLAVLAVAAAVAALPPALRAVRIDPARTLRAE
jgi:putative ABC transport system permease protein